MISRLTILVVLLFLASCAAEKVKKETTVGDLVATAADYPLGGKVADMQSMNVIEQYKEFLKKAKSKINTAAALRRIADLELEQSEAEPSLEKEMEKEKANEGKTDAEIAVIDEAATKEAKLSSIEHYEKYLKSYPNDPKNDQVIYQLAKAYAAVGEIDKALASMDTVVAKYPKSKYLDEVQFRRGEILFVHREFEQAEKAYATIVVKYKDSPLYEKALYKQGWSQFKQENYKQTLRTYLSLLDLKEAENKIDEAGVSASVSKSEKEFILDSLRVLSLSLSYLDSYKSIPPLFKQRGDKLYLPLIYQELAKLYIKKDRFDDAANTYMAYTKTHSQSKLSPAFHSLALKTYIDGKINDKVLASKILYVKNYGTGSNYWKNHDVSIKGEIRPELVRHIQELAKHFHAMARKSKKQKDFKIASNWYQTFLSSFPGNPAAASLNFLYAEALYDAELYLRALDEYEKSAYDYPSHDKNAEAAYAALLTYDMLLKQAKLTKQGKKQIALLRQKALDSSIRFGDAFPNDKHASAVITKTAENLFEAKDYSLASVLAKRIIDNKKVKQANLVQTSWLVYAHSQYELKLYDEAEKAYSAVIQLVSKDASKKPKGSKAKLIADLTDKLAASIYKQAEAYKAKGENQLAATYFLRVGETVPSSVFRASADYDAATLYMGMKSWAAAGKILEKMRRNKKLEKKFKEGISSKLLLVYTESGNFNKAAIELGVLAGFAKTKEDRRNIVWQTAEMYEKAGRAKQANSVYVKYISKYPKPFLQSIEAYEKVSDYYLATNSTKLRKKWLNKLIKAEKKGGKKRTDRTKYLAANAVYGMAQPILKRYQRVKLSIPLKKNLRTKKKRMKSAIAALKKVMAYKVAEFSTASTYQMGEIYNHLASSLMSSQRPKGLSVDELEQYDILLEEQAYPFEEKSADIHSLNAKRTKLKIYDKWVKKSLTMLKKIQPVRYAKSEKVEPYVLITH